MTLLVRELERARFAATPRPRKTASEADPTPSSRTIPRPIRRAVWTRDGGQCTFRDNQGRRCPASERRVAGDGARGPADVSPAMVAESDLPATSVSPTAQLHVTLAPLSSPNRTRADKALCEILDQTATIFPGSRFRIRHAVRPPPHIGLSPSRPRRPTAGPRGPAPPPLIGAGTGHFRATPGQEV